jgi:exodeoxyribonuclease V gamma subunit
VVPFADLQVAPPGPGESGDGWAAGETSRFGRYARRLWGGLLAAEEVSDR